MKRGTILSAVAGVLTTFWCQVWREYFRDQFEDYLTRRPEQRRTLEATVGGHVHDVAFLAPWPARHSIAAGVFVAATGYLLSRAIANRAPRRLPLTAFPVRDAAAAALRNMRRIVGAACRRLAAAIDVQ